MGEAKPEASSDAKPPRASPPRYSPPQASSAMGEAKPLSPRVIEVKPHTDEAEAPASVEMEVVELTSVEAQAPASVDEAPASEDEAPAPEEANAPAPVADVVEVIEMVEAAHEVSLESLDDVDVGMDDGIAAHHERRASHVPMAAHGARRIVTPSELHAWLTHSHRLLISKSMDDADCHILKLLQWVRLYLNRKAGRGRRITIACCGPPSVAHTVADAAERVGGDVQFAAEHVWTLVNMTNVAVSLPEQCILDLWQSVRNITSFLDVLLRQIEKLHAFGFYRKNTKMWSLGFAVPLQLCPSSANNAGRRRWLQQTRSG
jgi:hypothetical protein